MEVEIEPARNGNGAMETPATENAEQEERLDMEELQKCVQWIKERIFLKGYSAESVVSGENERQMLEFVSNAAHARMLCYLDDAGNLCVRLDTADPGISNMTYFVKVTGDRLYLENMTRSIVFGYISGNAVDSLLRLMDSVFVPNFLQNQTWPESIRKEFSGQLHKFMASLTETAHQMRGSTILYIPKEDLSVVDVCAKDKDLVQRLESSLIHWTRQIKEVVNNQGNSENAENSGPLAEIQFWRSRTVDLSGIKTQLTQEGVERIVAVLEMAKSSYLAPFLELSHRIQQGSSEAEDNLKFLEILQEPCEQLSQAEPKNLPEILQEVINRIRMIWGISRHYNTAERVTGLLRKVSNEIISRCCAKISLDDIYSGNVEAGQEALTQSVRAGETWKVIFRRTASALSHRSTRQWDFDESAIFAQIDAFVQRCRDLMEVCEGQVQFARKTDGKTADLPAFGGARGGDIVKSLLDIQASFEKQVHILASVNYNSLDVKATRWHDDFNAFKNTVKDLEVMMQNVISSGMEGVSSVSRGVELLEAFESIAKREAICRTVEKKTADVYMLFNMELLAVKREFDTQKKSPVIYSAHPRYSGAALWAKGMLERIQRDYRYLEVAHYLVATREQEEAEAAYLQLSSALEEYIRRQYNDWVVTVDGGLSKKLDDYLMVRQENGNGYLESNFDTELLKVIAETSYWEILKFEIPYGALDVAAQREKLRILRENVLFTVRDYNNILSVLSPEERALFSERIQFLDKRVYPGINKLTWNSRGVVEYFVKDCRKNCREVMSLVQDFKNAFLRIQGICRRVSETLLVSIEKKKVYAEGEFEEKQSVHRIHVKELLLKAHEEVKDIMIATYETFKNDSDKIQKHWLGYTRKIDQMVEDALRATVKRSLQEIVRAINGDAKTEVHPLFLVNVVLEMQRVEFKPSINNLTQMMNVVSKELITSISVVPRLVDSLQSAAALVITHKEENQEEVKSFYAVISSDQDILKILVSIMSPMTANSENLNKYLQTWDKHKHIWENPKDAFMRRYAKANRPLSVFDSDISRYRDLQNEIQNEETITNIKYVRIDCSPLKYSLISQCNQWQNKFTDLLNQMAIKELKALHDLFAQNSTKLKKTPKTLDELGESTTLLKRLQDDLPKIEARFDPVRQQYKTLEKFDVNVTDDEKQQLEALSVQWNYFKQVLQEADIMLEGSKDKFRRELLVEVDEFTKSIQEMRKVFLAKGPFDSGVGQQAAAVVMNEFKSQVDANKKKEDQLKRGLDIFGIEPPVYKENAATAKDLELLDEIWGLTKEWEKAWNQWKYGKFSEIDCTEMEETAQRYAKSLHKLGREIKNWEVHGNLKERVEQFRRTMPLINDLRNPAMRERHWDQLKEEIRKDFDPYAEDFTLEKIFSLGLDAHSEAIAALSNAASKELAIEVALGNIKTVWDELELDLARYKDKDIFRLRSTEEIFQNLEDNMVTLSTMKASRYFVAFEQRIDYWEKGLSLVSEVIEMILNVQRQWMYLENIFAGGSDDIRRQLPAESALFDGVNANFKLVMDRLQKDPNAFRGTHQDGLLDNLNSMNQKLEKIQKSLDQYLETKRQAFPRFYFLSNDDLLEILGQARDPMAVQAHMKKCFDNIKMLEILPAGKDGRRVNEAIGMHSSEKEYVPWINPLPLEGAVETWLTGVETSMRAVLKRVLLQCLQAQKTNKRDKWVASFPGQVTITASQITWTTDCTKALQDLEKNKSSMKQLKKRQVINLNKLLTMVRGHISVQDRLKVVALITIEVHARDVIDKMIRTSTSSITDFEWLSQLRFYWDKDEEDCIVRQTNTRTAYAYEYIGNAGRLVITPLTDRCYMTMTTALHLKRGGNPQGPAGTGKTETVKDLGKAVAQYVIVFNCSDGLDYKSLGRMFSGLSQTGAWSCFDEFNRIEIEVLSVVAQQILCVLNAIRDNLTEFLFEGQMIPIKASAGIFVTMNPGYAGRTELPDNLKALFRPVSMMVPDSGLISEIMLFSEGFVTARPLSKKIVTLYSLSIQQLSKQDHYDFGLRAIKSVLSMAGSLKRADVDFPEDLLLLRALKDMNMPKFVADDVPLFLGILQDLFPGTELPASEASTLKDEVIRVMESKNLVPNPLQLEKIMQVYECKKTRHGNMIVGQSGSGKSVAWRCLADAMTNLKKAGVEGFELIKTYVINPKAVSLGELYGEYDMATREWTDGILSKVIRDASADEKPDEKWLLLDGPVDTLWIESMNTVLDDNKMLTLINGERIALPHQVSLLFEVQDLSVASPATVSRAGMIYMNVSDLGWTPFLTSWRKTTITNAEEAETLDRLFEKYFDKALEFKRKECKELIPITELNAIASFTNLYSALATVENGVSPDDADSYARMIELWFLFSLIWSLGASLDDESRKKFDMFLREIEGQFPSKDTVYEYFVDPKKKSWSHWEDKISNQWRPLPDTPFYKTVVPTVDTVRNSFVLSTLAKSHHHILFVGEIGTGKTILVQSLIATLDEKWTSLTINFSSQTTSNRVQEIVESRIEKRTKNVFCPPGGKRMLTFVDDLNMPAKDTFGSQPPIELLRQWVEYGFWYDRQKQTIRNVKDLQLVCAMGPPGGGRSQISLRFQRNMHLINCTFPSESQIKRIYGTLVNLRLVDFDEEIKPLGDIMTAATLEIYLTVQMELLPTPMKSHYVFNMRDLSKVFEGVCRAHRDFYDTKEVLMRLWVHECYRVFHDRLVDDHDRDWFRGVVSERLASSFSSSWKQLFGPKEIRPTIFGDFMRAIDPPVYEEIPSLLELKKFVETKLEDYNMEPGAIAMDLVLFRDALEHVSRIHRIIRLPRGNALLVGVGGSGRQSLSRLAAYTADYKVFQIEISRNYRSTEFHEDLKKLYTLAGVEDKPTVFLFTDTQIVHESFLEDINNMLSSGEVPNLFPADELQAIRDGVRPAAKKAGVVDTPDSLYAFFIERVRANLHVILCMSPVGEGFRTRVRMYPALVSCTTINWFSEWPQDALREVAQKFIEDANLGAPEVKVAISDMFVQIQTTVSDMSRRLLLELKRHNYVTPTNYLELVTGYLSLLQEKQKDIGEKASKLRNGLSKLEETKTQVEEMSIELVDKKKIVAKSQKECEELLVVIVQERRVADEQAKQVSSDAERISKEEVEVKVIADQAQAELDKAIPALEEAMKALEALNKKDLAEVKAFTKPPTAVEMVMNAVMILRKAEPTWAEAKRQLSDANFLQSLFTYDKDAMSDSMLKKIDKYVNDPRFTPDEVAKSSFAAKSLCQWVHAMSLYGRVFKVVAPKRAAVKEATELLSKKQKALKMAQDKLQEVTDKVMSLKQQYDESVGTKERLAKEAAETEVRLARAEKLVDGLSGERARWEKSIAGFEQDLINLVGDCLIAAAFLSYAGPFPAEYRDELVNKHWLLPIRSANIPVSPNYTFWEFMANPTDVRDWNIQGLPSDNFSTENGVLVTRGRRWPLLIDPQEQGKKWIRSMESKNGLKVVTLKQADYLRTLENAVQFGTPVLMQDVEESLDPALEPLLNKSFVKQGNKIIMKLGDKEIEYNPEFRFYLTTKIANPHYPPEISTKTTITNCMVKEQGLEAQLLGIVVRKEKPELEEQKDQLVMSLAAGKRRMEELEDEILKMLSEASGSLLDNEELVATLQNSKTVSEEIKQQLQVTEATEKKIDKAREGYRPCANRAAILYFVLNDLGTVDPMYQFSLETYVELFILSIEKAPRSEELPERIRNVNDYHTYAVYRSTCRGLFEKHKLLFSLHMTVRIMQGAKKVNTEEYLFFLRGGLVLDRETQSPNPSSDWISDNAWDNITELDKLPNFRNIASSFEQNSRDWYEWYCRAEPEEEALPGEWENKCNELQRMIILRSLRSDRVLFAVRAFIVNQMSQKFVTPPVMELMQTYGDSTSTQPLIFVLSPGVDPTSNLSQLATNKNMGDKFKSLALGQGQAPTAMKLIEEGMAEGTWVFLANCHLMMSWMNQLEKIVENLSVRKPHPDFRLWLSSYPHPNFPISILQRGIKMTTEPPKGLKSNLMRLYGLMTEEKFVRCKQVPKYKKLLFSLCFFHSVLLERRKFLTLGWNIPYDFNDSDWEVSEDILALYLDEYPEKTPWDALKYLVAEVNYGGRVTDDWDRRLLNVYMNQFYQEDAVATNMYRLSSLAGYYIPEDGSLQSYREYIQTLPEVDRPEAFGQHSNADISSQIEESFSLLETLQGLQPRVVNTGGMTREEKVTAIVTDMLDKLPEVMDYDTFKESKSDDPTPFNVVLLQEVDRYNRMLRTMRISLSNLDKGIRGLVVISADLEEIFNYLHDGRVPPAWLKTYPSIKPLGSWNRDLVERVKMFNQWGDSNQPVVFWLGGFTFPTGFLTAVLQTAARKTNVSIDGLSWEFHVMNMEEKEIQTAPKDGVYISGLFLEGAGWDNGSMTLTEPNPMELICSMPVIWFKPAESKKKSLKGVYQCPLYMYPVRTGTRERPSFMLAVDLKSGQVDGEHWTKRGTALLLALAS